MPRQVEMNKELNGISGISDKIASLKSNIKKHIRRAIFRCKGSFNSCKNNEQYNRNLFKKYSVIPVDKPYEYRSNTGYL
jgi:hypothetical protein